MLKATKIYKESTQTAFFRFNNLLNQKQVEKSRTWTSHINYILYQLNLEQLSISYSPFNLNPCIVDDNKVKVLDSSSDCFIEDQEFLTLIPVSSVLFNYSLRRNLDLCTNSNYIKLESVIENYIDLKLYADVSSVDLFCSHLDFYAAAFEVTEKLGINLTLPSTRSQYIEILEDIKNKLFYSNKLATHYLKLSKAFFSYVNLYHRELIVRDTDYSDYLCINSSSENKDAHHALHVFVRFSQSFLDKYKQTFNFDF